MTTNKKILHNNNNNQLTHTHTHTINGNFNSEQRHLKAKISWFQYITFNHTHTHTYPLKLPINYKGQLTNIWPLKPKQLSRFNRWYNKAIIKWLLESFVSRMAQLIPIREDMISWGRTTNLLTQHASLLLRIAHPGKKRK